MLSPTPISDSASVVQRTQPGVHPLAAGDEAAALLPLGVLAFAGAMPPWGLGLALVAEVLAELAVDWPRRASEPLRAVGVLLGRRFWFATAFFQSSGAHAPAAAGAAAVKA